MSVTKKGAGIQFVIPEEAKQPVNSTNEAPVAPRSGVAMVALGGMATQALKKEMEATKGRLQAVEAELETYRKAGSSPIRIDARKIKMSKWANRHEATFRSEEFLAFKKELQESGGNLVPIKVRPLREPVDGYEYEIVYGHRRHRGCAELGLPVLSIVQEVDDKTLFTDMERENRGRASLSAYEQGTHYLRAINTGLFRSVSVLAAEIGLAKSTVSRAIRIAELPEEVIQCFSSPLAITFRVGALLVESNERDPNALIARAAEIRKMAQKPTDEQVLKLLLAKASRNVPVCDFTVGSTTLGSWNVSRKGGLRLNLELPPMTDSKRNEILEKLQAVLEEALK